MGSKPRLARAAQKRQGHGVDLSMVYDVGFRAD